MFSISYTFYNFVLICSADGNFEVTLATKATLFHTGAVEVEILNHQLKDTK